MESKVYTPKTFQETYHIGKSTFWKFIRDNPEFPIIRIGRKIIIPVKEADEFMKNLIQRWKDGRTGGFSK